MVDIHIRLHGYTVGCLDMGVWWLREVATFCGLTMRVSRVPGRRHRISVLQSPHVNKKSWEQFVEITRGRGLVTTCDPQRAQLYLALVERAHIPGVEVSLSLSVPTPLFIGLLYNTNYRSTSPKTMSWVPIIVTTSASI